ncbi:hypothetical protein RHMOL_Rhmol05G0113200 [Rhododendron molle]|uniref:Uncharacterized protein n=1 Tax=Rhododendron molle TaxID=49168 RepID=A0ACC0NN25_RHOML|nr:hypothetical protein RHMOL_Rhmol05G0113200 [Rhododendron molle]
MINNAKIVFLNERPQLGLTKGITNTCDICEWGLMDRIRFCSFNCKVIIIFCEVFNFKILERILRKFTYLNPKAY